MNATVPAQRVELVPVTDVTVINPRVRTKRSFDDLVVSIASVGLKKPITVTRRDDNGAIRYDLVCGQGRLEAFRALGMTEIPALVVEAERDDCLLASLIENFARRQHRALDLLHDIGGMKKRGDTIAEIARKTGLSTDYVRGVVQLLSKGEQRLLAAVEADRIPLSIAIAIAEASDEEIQGALQDAYEAGTLKGRAVPAARRLIDQRRRLGKSLASKAQGPKSKGTSAASLIRAYHEDADRKRMLIRKADATRSRLHFITQALERLLEDDALLGILRDAGIDSLPRPLAERMTSTALHHD